MKKYTDFFVCFDITINIYVYKYDKVISIVGVNKLCCTVKVYVNN